VGEAQICDGMNNLLSFTASYCKIVNCLVIELYTLRCQINIPPFIDLSIFFQPPDLFRTPSFINFMETDSLYKPPFYFFSLLVLFTLNFHGKIAYCCIHFSFILYDSLFLFFPSLDEFKAPSQIPTPLYFDHPFIKFRNFFQRPVY